MSHNNHGTEMELEFIEHLGSWGERHFDRVDLLKGYIEGALKRTKWGQINKKKVLDFAYKELEWK